MAAMQPANPPPMTRISVSTGITFSAIRSTSFSSYFVYAVSWDVLLPPYSKATSNFWHIFLHCRFIILGLWS
jgi:hypothetical protein